MLQKAREFFNFNGHHLVNTESINEEVDQGNETQLKSTVCDQNNLQIGSQNQPVSSQNHSSSEYRADIDGLRTIAISTVVIFHAFPLFMPGGFVGVDVFFVISGYLISGIIIKQASLQKFSILNFYERRIKRIYPALILVLFTSLVIAHKAYSEYQLKNVANTLAASTIFSANIQIMLYEKDYFDASEKENAFLHLWSLGVEEQFYIIWPCLISVLITKFRSKTTILLSIFTIGSFILGIETVYDYPKVAFYFPLCRFWQMSIGGLIAYKNFKIPTPILNHFLSITGTLAILTVVWIVSQKNHFPGWWALIPTISSACILIAGPEAFVNKYLLSTKVFVFVGKISYPLYLWHWPLMVFSRLLYPEGSKSIFGNLYFIIFLSIILSIITFFCVENRIRFRKSKIVVLALLCAMIFIGVYAKVVIVDKVSGRLITEDEINYDLPTSSNDSDDVKFMKEFQRNMLPTEADIYIKNGRKNPNSSKNPKRQSTSIQKLKSTKRYYDLLEAPYPRPPIMQKRIVNGSQYWVEYRPKKFQVMQVSNEGKQNTLFIVGDSHSRFLSKRLQFLYQESKKRNQTNSFPTIVSLSYSAFAYLSQTLQRTPRPLRTEQHQQKTAFFQRYFKDYKPKRLLVTIRWLGYWKQCQLGCDGHQPFSPQHMVIVRSQIEEFTSLMKELMDVGIQVNVVTLHMDDNRLNPSKMYDAQGVIEQNIKPLIYSEFRKEYADVFEYWESKMTGAGIKLIDFADNLCWEDKCQVLTPTGYPPYLDDHHYGLVYSKFWLSAVDHLVDF